MTAITNATVIRCDGPGDTPCHVGAVEYSETLDVGDFRSFLMLQGWSFLLNPGAPIVDRCRFCGTGYA